MEKKLLFFLIYQFVLTQKIITLEPEQKESSEMKIIKKYFQPLLYNLNKEELKAWLLLAAIPGMADKILCKRPYIQEDIDKDLKRAVINNNYIKIISLLKKEKDPMKGFPLSPFTLATANNQLNIKKLFVWHSDIPRCYIMLDDIAIFIKNNDLQEIAKFMIGYAPKISRIKNENIIKQLNNFLSIAIKKINITTDLNKLIESYCFYPEDSFEQVKLTYQDIDEIIDLYDNEFNKNNDHYKKLIAEAQNGLQKIEFFEIEENIQNSKKKSLRKLNKRKMRTSSCFCLLFK